MFGEDAFVRRYVRRYRIRYCPDGQLIGNGINYYFHRRDWRVIIQVFNDFRLYIRHRNLSHPSWDNRVKMRRWIISFERR